MLAQLVWGGAGMLARADYFRTLYELRLKESDGDKRLAPSTRDVSDKAQPIATDRNAACDEML